MSLRLVLGANSAEYFAACVISIALHNFHAVRALSDLGANPVGFVVIVTGLTLHISAAIVAFHIIFIRAYWRLPASNTSSATTMLLFVVIWDMSLMAKELACKC